MKVRQIPLGEIQANCYLVSDEKSENNAVIDPGCFDETLLNVLKDEKISSLDYILFTHGHYDHILGGFDLKQMYPNALTAIHEADAECLSNEEKSLAVHSDSAVQKHMNADVLLKDGDVLNLGGIKIEVMHTPGHSRGSVCYIIEEEKNIFSGDTLFCRTIGRTDFDGGSMNEMMTSLERLIALKGNYKVFTGHNRSTFLNDERNKNRYLSRLINNNDKKG